MDKEEVGMNPDPRTSISNRPDLELSIVAEVTIGIGFNIVTVVVDLTDEFMVLEQEILTDWEESGAM
jgi:hypothetical protein